jgi:hypothetical protein
MTSLLPERSRRRNIFKFESKPYGGLDLKKPERFFVV